MEKVKRAEHEVFDELKRLCSSRGYIHAIASICYRDNMVKYSGEMTSENLSKMYSSERLIRTEISLLIGLLVKHEIDYTTPSFSELQQYIDETEKLLEELHQSMSEGLFEGLKSEDVADQNFNPFKYGSFLREPIFYGGESAYSFQYRDLSLKKYVNDDDWLLSNKGFSIQTARDVAYGLGRYQDEKLMSLIKSLESVPKEDWSILPGFTFTSEEISRKIDIDESLIDNVLSSFAIPEGEYNDSFNTLSDFNIANALPLIRYSEDSYILFHIYSFNEALYESPFYWMCDDKKYVDSAMQFRGEFTEDLAKECLERVFGEQNVYTNVDIYKSKKENLGEIDVLALFGNRAIILQAKSKQLTIEARKGNDGQIKSDFKKSVQNSYDQGYLCAKSLLDKNSKLKTRDSVEINLPDEIKEIYIFCLVSDHYPALSFQCRQFLQFKTTNIVNPPFVMDVFTIDVMTEMLRSPLRFLSYVNRRTNYSDKLLSAHEMTILSYHLKQNLWVDQKYDMIVLEDDINTDLDVAMLVRREGIAGKETPDGILTRMKDTKIGKIISEIEYSPNPSLIDLGFMLLSLGEDALISIDNGIEKITKLARDDGKPHDVTIGVGAGSTGLTIHSNDKLIFAAIPKLEAHCAARKYTQKAFSWYGLCILPEDSSLRFGLNLQYKWEWDLGMEYATKNLPKSKNLDSLS